MSDAKADFNQFSTAAIALQARPPAFIARMVSLGICLMILIGLIFSFFAQTDIVVTTQGRVIPSGKSKVIQPLDAGIVRAILVRDGQLVKAGDTLIELDPTAILADREKLQREFFETSMDVLRVKAMLDDKETFDLESEFPKDIAANQLFLLKSKIAEFKAKTASLDAEIAKKTSDRDAITANITQLKNSLPLVKKKHSMRLALMNAGHMTETGLIETRLEVISQEKELSVQGNRLLESEAGLSAAIQAKLLAIAEFKGRASAELTEATKKRDLARQELVKTNQKKDLLLLKSPIDGIVQQLAVSTVGGVVTAAQQLLTIVPENTPLEIEAQILNRDIGFLKVGQRVINKVETFDFTRFGYIEGEVQWVGTDAVLDPKLGPVYPVRLTLKETITPKVVNGRKGIVTAGMSITSDILTDKRRLLEYFVAPMFKMQGEALRER